MKNLLAVAALALALPTAALAGPVGIGYFGAPSVSTPEFDSLGSGNVTLLNSPYSLGISTYYTSDGTLTLWGSGPGGGYADCGGGCMTNSFNQDLSFTLNQAYGAIGVYVGQATAYTLDVSFYGADATLLGTIDVSNSNYAGGLSFVGWESLSGVESVSIYNPDYNGYDISAGNIYVAAAVPEPGMFALFGMALLAVGGLGLRRKFV